MNTLEENKYTAAWRALGTELPRPRGILAISAHWYINGSAVTAMPNPRVIHDFYGFPQALFDFTYPAPGSPELAEEISEIVKPSYVAKDRDSWGIDHGTWSVLAHIFPAADIPVVQLSIHAAEDLSYHFDLGARLAPLRERGIFIMGSGNVVHNLRRIDWQSPERAFDWAEDFDGAVREIMRTDPKVLSSVTNHPAFRMAVPTPEHFLPLVYLAGISSARGECPGVLIEGGSMGSLTMTSYILGCRPNLDSANVSEPGVSLPDPAKVPPEDTNI